MASLNGSGKGFVECPKCQARHMVSTLGSRSVYSGVCEACGTFFKFRQMAPRAEIGVTVNGVKHTVSSLPATMRLNEYLRDVLHLTGTKVMCHEGGCGCCVVALTSTDPVNGKKVTKAVNSCLRPLYTCDGHEITTVEGVGGRASGYHEVQKRLAAHNGTQCGFCTPGMVMSMYSLLQESPTPSSQQIEDAFDGNICRCTGYRDILDAMKTFAKDSASYETFDIEELAGRACKTNPNKRCAGTCSSPCARDVLPVAMSLSDARWLAPGSLEDLYSAIEEAKGSNYSLIFGGTSAGSSSELYIDLQHVQELYVQQQTSTQLVLGANTTLTRFAEALDAAAAKDVEHFSYCTQLALQVGEAATGPVRNAGCIAGNLMLKRGYTQFPSDVFLVLVTCQATLQVWTGSVNGVKDVKIDDFMKTDMSGCLIQSVTLPALDKDKHFVRTYKVMPRKQSALAYVSCGINMRLDSRHSFLVLERPVITFGGISADFVRASETEQYLTTRLLNTELTLEGMLNTLDKEITPEENDTWASSDYRKHLTQALCYKFILDVCSPAADARYKSGGGRSIPRPVSSGVETYGSDKSEYPLTEPLPKRDAIKQCAGEVDYVMDIPPSPLELQAAYVLSTVGSATLKSIDFSEAENVAGFVRGLTHSDIPGTNTGMPPAFGKTPEEILASKDILYAGQPVAIVVCETFGAALQAAAKVKVTYTDVKTPIVTLQDAIDKKSFFPKPGDDIVIGDAEGNISKAEHKVSGVVQMGTQYHFTMETQICLAVPLEGGIEAYASTQWTDASQQVIANALGISDSKVQVSVRRLGGAYGSKITRNFTVGAAASVCAYVVNRPVRLRLTLDANMQMIGKRFPHQAQYQIGLDKDYKLQGVKITYYSDCGCYPNEEIVAGTMNFGDSAYFSPAWHLIPVSCKTNLPENTSTRSPASVQGTFIIEYIMEHAAKQLGVEPEILKRTNLYQKGQTSITGNVLSYCSITQMMDSLHQSAQLDERRKEVQQFNKDNRWRKRGLSVVPLKFGLQWVGAQFNVHVNIYNGDGSVAIAHGGIESGQGINMKTIQVCAYELGISMDLVTVQPTSSMANPNTNTTGGSITSELCVSGVVQCCKILKDRIAPIKTKNPSATWPQLVSLCNQQGIELSAQYMVSPQTPHVFQYFSYGVTCTEAELDVLTGEHQLRRVDMLYDCGQSMNPKIDVGQAEGAFVMGLGLWLTEHIKYDSETGKNLITSTWTYKPPSSQDIPVDFRVTFLKEAPNPLGILGNKGVGEPPLCMSNSALFAVKHAVEAARAEIGKDQYFRLDGPATVDLLQEQCLVDKSHMRLGPPRTRFVYLRE